MKLIIDIPDEDYKFIKEVQLYLSVRRSGKTIERNVINAIKNGLPYEERPQVNYPKVDSHKAYWDNVGRADMRGGRE